MPYIQFDHSLTLTDEERRTISAFVTDRYAREMGTSTGHVAVVLRRRKRSELALGRARDGEPVVFVAADVRRGRPFERRRSFARSVMDRFRREWSVPRENLKVVFTEHPGDDMMGYDRIGTEWSTDE